ncbi:UTRA domain-containing protein [Streptomyces olivaceus]|nr:UTRA domain-containing protein [Streptomyces olivaceus]
MLNFLLALASSSSGVSGCGYDTGSFRWCGPKGRGACEDENEGLRIVSPPLYARLAELGHKPLRFREEVRSRMPSKEEAEQLSMSAGTPVILVCRTAYTGEGRAVEVNEAVRLRGVSRVGPGSC